MSDHLVITIGRHCGSKGNVIGRKLAEVMGVKCYNKELLAEAAKHSGLCEELFETHDEKPTNSFLYSLVMFIVVFLWGHIQSPGPIVTLEQIFVGCAVYCTILFIKKDPLFFEIYYLVKKYLKRRILK